MDGVGLRPVRPQPLPARWPPLAGVRTRRSGLLRRLSRCRLPGGLEGPETTRWARRHDHLLVSVYLAELPSGGTSALFRAMARPVAGARGDGVRPCGSWKVRRRGRPMGRHWSRKPNGRAGSDPEVRRRSIRRARPIEGPYTGVARSEAGWAPGRGSRELLAGTVGRLERSRDCSSYTSATQFRTNHGRPRRCPGPTLEPGCSVLCTGWQGGFGNSLAHPEVIETL